MIPGIASLSLLFVAAGLLVLAGVSIGRTRGHQPSRVSRALMAGMTGGALGFLLLVLWVPPLVLLPLGVATILAIDWAKRRELLLLGSFLIGAGGLWVVMQVQARLNDLADPAVTIPGWTPIPLLVAGAALILGVGLAVIGRAEPT